MFFFFLFPRSKLATRLNASLGNFPARDGSAFQAALILGICISTHDNFGTKKGGEGDRKENCAPVPQYFHADAICVTSPHISVSAVTAFTKSNCKEMDKHNSPKCLGKEGELEVLVKLQ